MTTVFRARWVIPAQGEPIADGAVVAAGGRIVRVGPWAAVAPHVGPSDPVEHFPASALVPGFVNAHTHLSLSDMAGKFRPTANFAGWIMRLAGRRQLRTQPAMRRAVEDGARAARQAGTVAGADLSLDAPLDDNLGRDGVRWTVFGEVLRFGQAGRERLEQAITEMEHLAQTGPAPSGGRPVRVGLSPHAPYTVSPELYVAVKRAADERGWPVATHLHETLDEIAFTERGEGKLHTWLSTLGFLPRDWRPAGLRPIPMLAQAGFFSGPVLVGHGNYLTDEDMAILARSGSSVVYCPRSHAFFKHADHPWRRLLAAGVNVCLGTDSLASCPTLSMLDEVRFLASRAPDADPRVLLDMATRRGARALGLGDEVGDLAPGLAAALCVIGPVTATREPLAAILAGEGRVECGTAGLPDRGTRR
jgi:cytosine/adenosine deaminase-related metal-dependent hydrolase